MSYARENYSVALFWNRKFVVVHCRCCKAMHSFSYPSISWNMKTLHTRSFSCQNKAAPEAKNTILNYFLVFPFDDTKLADLKGIPPLSWEITRDFVLPDGEYPGPGFATIGIDMTQFDNDVETEAYENEKLEMEYYEEKDLPRLDLDSVARDISDIFTTLTISDHEASSVISLGNQSHRFAAKQSKYFLHDCANGNIERLKELISAFPDSNFPAKSDSYGHTGLFLAAMRGHLKTIEFLVRHNAHIDSQNYRGRTPLMEAALWGNSDIVLFLLSQNANAKLQDHKGRTALQMATPTELNRKERIRRSVFYKEYDENSVGDSTRRLIAAVLENAANTRRSSFPHEGQFIPLIESGLEIGYYSLSHDRTYHITEYWKAIGRMSRPDPLPIINAISGYNGVHDADFINNWTWTDKAKNLYQSMGYKIESDKASHVETQLMTYYVDKHVAWDLDWGFNADFPTLEPVKPPSLIKAEIWFTRTKHATHA